MLITITYLSIVVKKAIVFAKKNVANNPQGHSNILVLISKLIHRVGCFHCSRKIGVYDNCVFLITFLLPVYNAVSSSYSPSMQNNLSWAIILFLSLFWTIWINRFNVSQTCLIQEKLIAVMKELKIHNFLIYILIFFFKATRYRLSGLVTKVKCDGVVRTCHEWICTPNVNFIILINFPGELLYRYKTAFYCKHYKFSYCMTCKSIYTFRPFVVKSSQNQFLYYSETAIL